MIGQELISLLACPETQQPLVLVDQSILAKVNDLIKQGALRNRDQKILKEECSAILVREDKKYCYPVIDGIPVLIVEEGIDFLLITS